MVALRFHLDGKFPLGLPDTVRLKVSGGGTGWNSDPAELKAWKSLSPNPLLCTASFAATWEPGNYTAGLEFSGTNRKQQVKTTEIQFKIRPSDVNKIPAGRKVNWRFTGSPPLPRKVAQLNLSVAPRTRLDCSDADRGYLLQGWHDTEALGGNRFRRWTQSHASAVLGGPGNRLRIILEDRRPRQSTEDATSLTLRVDDLPPVFRTWTQPGRQLIEIPWPADGLIHQLLLDIDPVFTPRALNLGNDSRELGVLIYSLKVFHG